MRTRAKRRWLLAIAFVLAGCAGGGSGGGGETAEGADETGPAQMPESCPARLSAVTPICTAARVSYSFTFADGTCSVSCGSCVVDEELCLSEADADGMRQCWACGEARAEGEGAAPESGAEPCVEYVARECSDALDGGS